ncbi:MAG: hypothetical protein IKD61_03675 [Oscillospiraceae bacterium]|nr:hypothetical protein [Oscillospiraceae bacterium]
MSDERMSVREAAEALGISQQLLRVSMQRNLIDIGFVTGTKRVRTYVIYRDKVEALRKG